MVSLNEIDDDIESILNIICSYLKKVITLQLEILVMVV